MTTTNARFVTKNGLDNNSNSITNLGVTGASLTLSGANALTFTTTGTTGITLPTSGTLVSTTAAAVLTNKTFTGYTETVYVLSGTSIDPANGTVQTKTLSGNTTFTEAIADGQSVVLMLNPSTFTTTWPTTSWVNSAGSGAAPTLKASVINVIVLWQVAGVLYGNWVGSM